MIRRKTVLPWLILALFLAAPAQPAEDNGSLPVSRILNPLPDFDPFEKAAPAPEFFPDDVSRRVSEALADSLAGREQRWSDHVRFFQEKDAELKRELGAVTGLADGVLDLFHNTLGDRRRYLEAQRSALASAGSAGQKRLVESRLRNDDLAQAAELLRTGKANRWGSLLNRVIGSVDLIGLASGSYTGVAVDSALSLLLAGDLKAISPEERKALVHYREHLKRYPADPENPDIEKRAALLERRKTAALAQARVDDAESALGKGDLVAAGFHYDLALLIDPSSRAAQEGKERLEKTIAERETGRRQGLRIAKEEEVGAPDAEERLGDLLYSLTLRDPEEIRSQAGLIESRYPGTPLADAAKDAVAVALEMEGRHDEAKALLAGIAASAGSDRSRERAQQLLDSPDYDLLPAFRRARSEHRIETIKFVLNGEDLIKKNLLYGAAPIIASGPAAAGSLAAANVLLIGTNLYQLFTANPVSRQAIIDKGEAYLRSHPESENAPEVARVLARAYEDAGSYDKAIAYYEKSGLAGEGQIAALKAKAAKAMLQSAERTSDSAAREFYLTSILDDYPDSPSADEALRKLAAGASNHHGFRISKKFLQENPDLYGPRGLGLKATLFDGNPGNMELADRGISLPGQNDLVLFYETPWGVQSRFYRIEPQALDRFETLLREKNQQAALKDVHERAKGSQGGIRNLPPSLLLGSLERDADPSKEVTLTFVREAGAGADFGKVLDYEILSEAEKNPAGAWRLPQVQGSISRSGFGVSGSLPGSLVGDRLRLGFDEKSPFAGLEFPLPYLQGFVPVDFLLQGGPGRFSVFPRIQLRKDKIDDPNLYR